MKSKYVKTINGVECYEPVPENEVEARQIETNATICVNFIADMILKYYSVIKEKEQKSIFDNSES